MKFTYSQDDKDSPWYFGQYGDYYYEAKVFDNPSEYGYKDGRIKKFSIYDQEDNAVVRYDGQFTEGSWKHHLYDPLIEELEELPLSTDSYFKKLKHSWGF